MKSAIYIENGFVQLALTADNEFEANILNSWVGRKVSAEVRKVSFYEKDKTVNQFVHERQTTTLIARIQKEPVD